MTKRTLLTIVIVLLASLSTGALGFDDSANVDIVINVKPVMMLKIESGSYIDTVTDIMPGEWYEFDMNTRMKAITNMTNWNVLASITNSGDWPMADLDSLIEIKIDNGEWLTLGSLPIEVVNGYKLGRGSHSFSANYRVKPSIMLEPKSYLVTITYTMVSY